MELYPEVEERVANGLVKKKAQRIFENIHLESESSSERTKLSSLKLGAVIQINLV